MAFQGSMDDKVKYYRSFFSGLKTLRSNFEDIWMDIDRYVFGFTGSYNSNPLTGQLTFENVYDTTAINANVDATNALVGILWQSGGRSIRVAPAEGISESAENIDWFKKNSDRFISVLDDPNARLVSSLTEYTADALGRGSSSVGTYRGTTAPLLFKNHPVRYVYFQENDEGTVDTVALRTWMPAYMAVERYGADKVSDKVVKQSQSAMQRNSEVEIILFIKPNKEKDKDTRPFDSVHVDFTNDHVIHEGFYEDLPIKVGRIFKNAFETYGRCPAINALSDIKRVNAVTGDLYENIEKVGSPSLGVLGSGVINQGVIDLSAGAVNMLNSQAVDGLPIQPIQTVGDLSPSIMMVEKLQIAIKEAYQINKLIDLNNDSDLTATEALILDRIRNTSLGALLSRQINEVYTPLMETSFNTLFNDGYFGYIEGSELLEKKRVELSLKGESAEVDMIPTEIAEAYNKGDAIYKIEYLTPAARMLQSEEANKMNLAFSQVAQYAQADPSVLDNINFDEAAKNAYQLNGVGDLLRSDEEVAAVRKEKAKIQQQQLEQQQAQQEAETAKTASEIQQ